MHSRRRQCYRTRKPHPLEQKSFRVKTMLSPPGTPAIPSSRVCRPPHRQEDSSLMNYEGVPPFQVHPQHPSQIAHLLFPSDLKQKARPLVSKGQQNEDKPLPLEHQEPPQDDVQRRASRRRAEPWSKARCRALLRHQMPLECLHNSGLLYFLRTGVRRTHRKKERIDKQSSQKRCQKPKRHFSTMILRVCSGKSFATLFLATASIASMFVAEL